MPPNVAARHAESSLVPPTAVAVAVMYRLEVLGSVRLNGAWPEPSVTTWVEPSHSSASPKALSSHLWLA
jgi:hypothetical protein